MSVRGGRRERSSEIVCVCQRGKEEGPSEIVCV